MRETKIQISVLLFALLFSVFSLANNTSNYDDLVKNAANQINYLENYNSNQDISKKWFIYFLGEDTKFLQEVLLDKKGTKQNFSEPFLTKLNEQLITINSNKDAVIYVAITDIGTSIVLPLLPRGGSIQDKIDFIKDEIDNPTRINDINDLTTGKKQYEAYKQTFEKLGQDIYDKSSIKSSNSKHKVLPFFAFHTITHINGKSKKSKLYLSNTTHVGGAKIDKTLLGGLKGDSSGHGETWYELSISKTIDTFDRYFRGNKPIEGIQVITNKDSDLYKASYENRYELDKVFTPSAKILDFAGISSEKDKTDLAKELGETQLLAGMQMYVVFTDDDTNNDIVTNLQTLKPTSSQYYIWIHIGKNEKTTINHIVPKNFKEELRIATQHWTADVWDNIELNSNKATKDFLFSFIVAENHKMSVLSGLMEKLIIPKEYWDANDPSYIPEMKYVVQAMEVSSGNLASIFDANQAQLTFAFKVGIFNGVVEEFKGLVDLGELLTGYITNEEEAKNFDTAISNLTFDQLWQSVKNAHGFEDGKPLEEFQLSHQLGKDVVFVASFWVGIGELTSATKMAKALTSIKKLFTFGSIKLSRKLSSDIVTKLRNLPDAIRPNVFRKLNEIGESANLQRLLGSLKKSGKKLENLDEFIDELLKLHKQAEFQYPGSVKNIQDFVDDLDYFVKGPMKNVKDDNLTKFFNEMLETPDKLKAGATSFEVIKNPGKYMDNVGGLDDLEDVISTVNGTGDFRFDLKFKNSLDDKIKILVDTKNYASQYNIFKDLSQIKAYFKQIKNFKEFRIVQQAGRGFDLNQMKKAFKTALNKQDIEELFKLNEDLFKTLKHKNINVKTFEDLEDLIKSESFIESELASILKMTL